MQMKRLADTGHEIMAALCRQVDRELSVHLSSGEDGMPSDSHDMHRSDVGARCTSADVYLREMRLIDHLNEEECRVRIIAYRQIIRDSSSDAAYSELKAQLIGDLSKATRPALAAELRALCGRMYRRYALVSSVETVRSGVGKRVCLVTALVIIVVALAVVAVAVAHGVSPRISSESVGFTKTCAIVMSMGAWGAAVSTLFRLYAVDIRTDPLINWLSLEKSAFSVWTSPMLGATFAMIFAGLFYAGIVHVDLFPDFDPCYWKGFVFEPAACVHKTVEKAQNAAYRDIAKLAMWSFIAGWGERLVPDALNNLTSRAANATQGKT